MANRDNIFEDFDDTAEKPKAKPEVKSTMPEPEPKLDQRILLSNNDAIVYDRMKAQPKTLDEVDIKATLHVNDPDKHQLSLPDELKAYGKRYAFRWINKSKRAIDYSCDVRGWVLANRSHFPEVPDTQFTVNGAIERGDSILAFMPIAKAEAIRNEPALASKAILNAQFEKHKDDPRYYTPKDDESSRVQMI